ncbi:Leucine-rich repeat-containing protein [Artemisia annua]|uniref:Leucine-rich repeat-containing protein n=1 Tax=Artemisia annua TaxID=35608 RepID=A0A2U1PB07_ARTAN|nr:Leucine-rich repeat-containing protein [Artemisia annua]
MTCRASKNLESTHMHDIARLVSIFSLYYQLASCTAGSYYPIHVPCCLLVGRTFAEMMSTNSYIFLDKSEALLLFKHNLSSINYSFDDTLPEFTPCKDWLGSSYYPLMLSWNTSTDCCNWDGVTCDYSTGDVIGIDVSCGMLQGTIHPNTSLFNLPHLQILNLTYNDFIDSKIPREIGRFSNTLTHLDLSGCGFSGQVPPDITLLHKLVSLDLSFNYGSLMLGPHVFINMFQNFTNLEEISLEQVNISSVLPTSLNISSSLKLLYLNYTELQGILPHYIFNIHSLEGLDLSLNSFTGNIPLDISVNLTHLTYLDLSDNQLNGTLPSWLFTSPSLEYLSLRSNMFSRNLPFGSLALPSLKELHLGGNQLTGQIDVQTFLQLTNLTFLGLSNNNFSGEWELDTLLSRLTNLEVLGLSYNSLSVKTKNANHYVNPGFRELYLASCKLKVFPNSFQAMRKLEWLDLSRNEIHGQIPHWVGKIGGNELQRLTLSHNFITGLPQFQWYGLEELYLQSNLIQGPFPPSICNLSNLRRLDMSNNSFGGVIPECVGSMSTLSMIDLGTNNFHGTIPKNISSSLSVLNVKSNKIEGSFPPSVCNMSYLRSLDMSNNSFGGVIPECVGSMMIRLSMINLGTNNFHGTIPDVFNECFLLEGLILNGNQLEGEVPHSLSRCQSLKVLDLGNNKLNGAFPKWLGGLSELQAMQNMVRNRTIPEYLSVDGNSYSMIAVVKDVQQTFTQLLVGYTII